MVCAFNYKPCTTELHTSITRVITYARLRVIETYIVKVTHYFLDGLNNVFFVFLQLQNTFCYNYAEKKSNILS